MSIAKQIIFGTTEDVAAALELDVKLEEVDEYGYAPLVQTAIVNSVNKARLLIEAGADVNFTDLTGRTALHWAADNNNEELAELLLEHGADANAYMRAGQPILVMPLLRDQYNIKQILYEHGANLEFAQDFINAKTLGHRFDLESRVDVVNDEGTFIEVEFEGFYLEFSLALVVESLRDFERNFGGKHLRQYFDKLNVIVDCLKAASELIVYQHYMIDIREHQRRINQLLSQYPLVIPIAYEGHAITFIKFGRWFLRCDRGEFGKNNGTIIIYKVGRPQLLSRAFIKQLIYKRQSKEFIENGLAAQLELEVVDTLPLSPQISGNCSWANVEAVISALLFMLLLDEMQIDVSEREETEEYKNIAINFYEEWLEWDKQRALDFCVQSFYSANNARKASKASVLAAILFQRCQYGDPQGQNKADKILPILMEEKFSYILKSYFEIFGNRKTEPRMDSLASFLDDFGIDIKSFGGHEKI